MERFVLAVIPARGGSKGLPRKNILPLAGRPMIVHTIEQALRSRFIDDVCVTSDLPEARAEAERLGAFAVIRPAELATDTATVDSAMRHAVLAYEAAEEGMRGEGRGLRSRGRGHAERSEASRPFQEVLPSATNSLQHRTREILRTAQDDTNDPSQPSTLNPPRVTHVVLLYPNVPVRPEGLIDQVIRYMLERGGDSVRSLSAVSKQHPDWLQRLDGERMVKFRPNAIYRRQDLEPLYYHDGAVVVVTRDGLFTTDPTDPHAFLGRDRRGLVHDGLSVDVDSPEDFDLAEAIMSHRALSPSVHRGSRGPLHIGGHDVGRAGSVYVIAEAGVNHNGSLDQAKKLIAAAREAGADAIKFQIFKADHLASDRAATCEYQRQQSRAPQSQRELLRRLELTVEAFAELRREAASQGLAFLLTPFGLTELEAALSLKIDAIKIASPDIVNIPLLRGAAAGGLPIILSTGAADAEDIDLGVRTVRKEAGDVAIALLHCVSAYPTRPDQARLSRIGALAARYGVPTGFSDHTAEADFGGIAVASGAVILEKHLTLDRTQAGPDHFFSLTPAEFATYVRTAKAAAAAMGDGALSFGAEEAEVRKLARGSLVAIQDIQTGTIVRAEHLRVQRPGTGISPAHWDRVIGRIAATDIPCGAGLAWTMLQP